MAIDACCKSGDNNKVEELVNEMQEEGIKADVYVYTSLIGLYGKKGELQKALKMFRLMRREGVSPNIHAYIALLDAYIRAGDVDEGNYKGLNYIHLFFFASITDYYSYHL